MALVYDKQGEYTKALAFYDKALAIRLEALGPDHPDTAAAYNNMAIVYKKQGGYPVALKKKQNYCSSIIVDKNIARFDVFVDNAFVVHVSNASSNLPNDVLKLWRGSV
jgi:tetratricopeptide (TPR) repeat protein